MSLFKYSGVENRENKDAKRKECKQREAPKIFLFMSIAKFEGKMHGRYYFATVYLQEYNTLSNSALLTNNRSFILAVYNIYYSININL